MRVAGLLVPLAVEKRNQQEELIVRQADVARVGYGGGHVTVGGLVVVEQHVAQQPRFGRLVPDADAHILDPVEEEPVLKFDRLLLPLDIVHRAVHLFIGVWHQVVDDEKTADGDHRDQIDERLHDLGQRHAG